MRVPFPNEAVMVDGFPGQVVGYYNLENGFSKTYIQNPTEIVVQVAFPGWKDGKVDWKQVPNSTKRGFRKLESIKLMDCLLLELIVAA
jgi:hypothetical protein